MSHDCGLKLEVVRLSWSCAGRGGEHAEETAAGGAVRRIGVVAVFIS